MNQKELNKKANEFWRKNENSSIGRHTPENATHVWLYGGNIEATDKMADIAFEYARKMAMKRLENRA